MTTSSPQSYTIDEMHEVNEAMEVSTTEVEVAMRVDFSSIPSELQPQMLSLLKKVDPENHAWRETLLLRHEA